MANTYVPIQTVHASSGALSAIEFTSIPSIYRDLVIRINWRGVTSNTAQFALQMRFNDSSATSQYYARGMDGYAVGGTGVSGQNGLNYLYTGNFTATPNSASTFANCEIYIPNYTLSRSKVYTQQNNSGNDYNSNPVYQQLYSGIWVNTSAINKISMYNEYGTFGQHSKATIYGISA